MGVKKAKKSKSSKVGKAVKSALGLKGKSGGGRRRHGPSYWANKVLVEKLKKRYNKLKYGGMR